MDNLKIIKGIVNSKLFGKPFTSKFYVTRKCNLRCGMCSVWKYAESKEMNLKEIKLAAEKMKKLGVNYIIITGGEPLLRKDIVEIVNIFSNLGMSTRLQTNGLLLTKEKLNELIKAGLNDITISIDTLNNKKQDEICGVKSLNMSDKSLETLKLVSEKMPNSMTIANIVFSHKNIDEIIKLIKILDSLNVWPTFCPVSLAEESNNQLFKAKADCFNFTRKDLDKMEKIFKEIFYLKKQGYKISLSSKYLKQSLDYIKTGNRKWICNAGELYFVIFPKGQFSLCDDVETKYNILDKNFIEKYKSKKFKNFMKHSQNKCNGCIYGIFRETSELINSPLVIFDRFLTIVRVKKREFLKNK
ncbi:MAG: radical SAM protein [Nanoarchaeota archaeon]